MIWVKTGQHEIPGCAPIPYGEWRFSPKEIELLKSELKRFHSPKLPDPAKLFDPAKADDTMKAFISNLQFYRQEMEQLLLRQRKDMTTVSNSLMEAKQYDDFISDLQFCCQDMKQLFLRQPKKSEHVEQMKKVLNSLRRAFNYLDDIRKGKLYIGTFLEHLNELWSARMNVRQRGASDPMTLAACECIRIAPEVQNSLQTIIDTIDKTISSINLVEGRPKADHFKFVKLVAQIFNYHLEKPTAYREGLFVRVIRILYEALATDGKIGPIEYPDRAITSALKELTDKTI